MKCSRLLPVVVLLAGILVVGASPFRVGSAFSKITDRPLNENCHIRFPAIREETLFSERPVLKDWSDGDIIDFYGPCGWDPLGKEEIENQRAEYDEAIDD